jgi:four helix bundle protein
MQFDFERLKVYQKALGFVDEIFDICEGLPADMQSSVGDQLRRASLSVANNIAEGSDQSSVKRKAVFYEIALHSGRECIPPLSVMFKRSGLDTNRYEQLREACSEICKMLVGLIRSTQHE